MKKWILSTMFAFVLIALQYAQVPAMLISRTALISDTKHGYTEGDPKEYIEIAFEKSGVISSIKCKSDIPYPNIIIKKLQNEIQVIIEKQYAKLEKIYIRFSVTGKGLSYSSSYGSKLLKSGTFEETSKNTFPKGYALRDENYFFTAVSECYYIYENSFDGFEYITFAESKLHLYYKGFENYKISYSIQKSILNATEEYNGEDWSVTYPDVEISNYKACSDNAMINIINFMILEKFDADLSLLLVPSIFIYAR